MQELNAYINSIGINNLVGKAFYIRGEEQAHIIMNEMSRNIDPVIDFKRADYGNVIEIQITAVGGR